MQTTDIVQAMSTVNWLFGIIVFLLSVICIIGGYFLKKLHDTFITDHEKVTKDHEVVLKIEPMVYEHETKLTKLITEHEMRHSGG